MKKINFLFNLIIAVGVFVIFGAAGGSDMGEISISEIFTYVLSGLSLISLGHAGKTITAKITSVPKKSPAVIKRLPIPNRAERNVA